MDESRDSDGGPESDAGGLVPSDPEVMRRLGYRAVDHIVARWAALEELPPWGGAAPDRTRELIHTPPPEEGMPVEVLMEQAVRDIFPLAGKIDHPRFVGFVPSGPAWESVLADILVSGHNVFQGTWLESAGPSQVELTVLEWFRQWLGMPEGASGILTSGGSAANLLAVVTAREVAGWPEEPVIYLSDQGHNSLRKAARTAGLRPRQVRTLPTTTDRVLRPEVVARAVAEDRASGRTPVLVCGNGGATNTGTVDPLTELAHMCSQEAVRFHVDAAYGGFAMLTDRGKRELEGLGEADSVTLDPHKWLFQTYECGCLMVRDPRQLEAAFRLSAEYLQDTELDRDEVTFRDRGIQLTRRFRALKVWLSLKALGRRAVAEAVRGGIELAEQAQERIGASPELELLHPARLGVVCFRYRPLGSGEGPGGTRDAGGTGPWTESELETLNAAIQSRMLDRGHAMMSSTRLDGRYSLRFCILNHRTRWRHISYILDHVEDAGRELAGSRTER